MIISVPSGADKILIIDMQTLIANAKNKHLYTNIAFLAKKRKAHRVKRRAFSDLMCMPHLLFYYFSVEYFPRSQLVGTTVMITLIGSSDSGYSTVFST